MTDSQPDVQKRIDQSTLPGESNIAGQTSIPNCTTIIYLCIIICTFIT